VQLKTSVGLAYPRDRVFAVYRDQLLGTISKTLPDIRSVELISRVEDGPVIRQVSRWHGGGEIPGPLRQVLSEEMLSWTAHDTWDAKAMTCDWEIESLDAVSVGGKNSFLEEKMEGGTGTLIEIRGELKVDPGKIPGVPGWMGGVVGAALEAFLGGRTEPNIVACVRGIDQFLQHNP
jgi:hypothetical protein